MAGLPKTDRFRYGSCCDLLDGCQIPLRELGNQFLKWNPELARSRKIRDQTHCRLYEFFFAEFALSGFFL